MDAYDPYVQKVKTTKFETNLYIKYQILVFYSNQIKLQLSLPSPKYLSAIGILGCVWIESENPTKNIPSNKFYKSTQENNGESKWGTKTYYIH